MAEAFEYRYLGDRHTDPALRQGACRAVRRADGKCIRGRNGSMLVRFETGALCVVMGRLLRKIRPDGPANGAQDRDASTVDGPAAVQHGAQASLDKSMESR